MLKNRRDFIAGTFRVGTNLALASTSLYVVGHALDSKSSYVYGVKWTNFATQPCLGSNCCNVYASFSSGDCSSDAGVGTQCVGCSLPEFVCSQTYEALLWSCGPPF